MSACYPFYAPEVLPPLLLGVSLGEALSAGRPVVDGWQSAFARSWAAHLTELDDDRQAPLPISPDVPPGDFPPVWSLMHLALGVRARTEAGSLPPPPPGPLCRAPSLYTAATLVYACRADLALLPEREPVELPAALRRHVPHAREAIEVARLATRRAGDAPARAAQHLEADFVRAPMLLWQAQALWAVCRVPARLDAAVEELRRLGASQLGSAGALLGGLVGVLGGMDALAPQLARVPASVQDFVRLVASIPADGRWPHALAERMRAENKDLLLARERAFLPREPP